MDSLRSVRDVTRTVRQLEGAGFPVRRPFPSPHRIGFDPFILLDEMGPVDWEPGAAIGAPAHPHRGFETVTYLLAGRIHHRDSKGNEGFLGPGDVQWMTAGRGIIHSELPERGFLQEGGRMHGFQLWVNLPAADKMMRPRYQEIPRSQIPIGTADNGRITARVLAGEALGVSAVIDTRTPILYVHYTLAPEARVHTEIPPEYEVFAYVFSGGGTFGPKATPAEAGEMVHFERDGAGVSLASGSKERLDLLLIGGQPLGEPVVQYGPFVMNTEAQIMQAIHDYQTGQFTT